MSGDSFGKVTPGSPLKFPAEVYNRLVEVARGVDLDKSGRARDVFRQSGIIKIRNDSAEDVPQFGILGLKEPLILPDNGLDEFKRRVTLSGVTPTSTHLGKFGVLLEPLAKGAMGNAVVSGVVQIRLSVNADDLKDFAEVVPGDTGLLVAADEGSATVLWIDEEGAESSENERWAIVRLDGGNRQALYPRAYYCLNGILKEYEVRPSGNAYLRDVACCDDSCASGSGLLDSDECCANYPPKICLQFSTNFANLMTGWVDATCGKTKAGFNGLNVTMDWYDSIPGVGNRGYYVSTTNNLGEAFTFWLDHDILGGCAYFLSGSSITCAFGLAGYTLGQGPYVYGSSGNWNCSPFEGGIYYGTNLVMAFTTGECPGGGSGYADGIPTACCPTANTPNILTATITNKTGWLTCLPDTLTMVYSDAGSGPGSITPAWYAQIDPCCTETAYLQLRCNAGTWELHIVNASAGALSAGGYTISTLVCDPFEIEFSDYVNNGTNLCQPGMTGGATITITE